MEKKGADCRATSAGCWATLSADTDFHFTPATGPAVPPIVQQHFITKGDE
jgi:hypothetical protein